MIFLLAPLSNKAGIKECIAAIKDAFNRLKEIPIATIYGDEISNLNPIPYGIKVLIITIKHKFFNKG